MKRRKPRQASLSSLKKKAWRLLSQIIRRSSATSLGYVRCYTCGAVDYWKSMDAGHAIPGRTGTVLFDEDIIRIQCKVCNIWKRGNYPVFTLKLINEHSTDWFEKKLNDSHNIVKLTTADMKEKIKGYEKRLKLD